MSCTNPAPVLLRKSDRTVTFMTRDRYVQFLKNRDIDEDVYDVLLTPCGKCYSCRLKTRQEWAQRIMFEASLWPEDSNWFVTLTYDDDHLPPAADPVTGELDGSSLNPKDLQDFNKRLREYFSRVKGCGNVRFFGCGEYGDLNARPHMHVIYFNLPLDDLQFWRKSKSGYKLYISDTLSKLWKFGHVEIEQLHAANAAYVAGYTMKKVGKQIDYRALGVYPEFSRMSRRPGIGAGCLESLQKDILSDDLVYLSSGGHARPAKYFLYRLEKLGVDLTEFKERRKDRAVLLSDLMPKAAPESFFEDLKEREKLQRQKNISRRG